MFHFAGCEAIMTTLSDQFPRIVKDQREMFIAFLFSFYFLVGLALSKRLLCLNYTLLRKYRNYMAKLALEFEIPCYGRSTQTDFSMENNIPWENPDYVSLHKTFVSENHP